MNIPRERILETLERGWAGYVTTFDEWSPEVQAEFLLRQGYRRFEDVLAHVIAWWRRGRGIVESLVADSAYQATEVEVDAFNAQAIEDFSGQDGATVRQAFEAERQKMVDLVTNLSAEAMESEKIVGQLNMEIIGHMAEHAQGEY